ncbi:magnesium/cobalt transporter CorA [Geobacter hydrogenophilus]|uniref:Magnesium transport protein CorA n=1 Tax=Geobacter hydrogenophilus TaxID=40983 RepID=A0A9W6G0J4_9BACT|nr:magnesium/cobalt transporter CorA [Geobacter hydrogenophilus]MBT0893902.1 magnesium/cobalt transporter CorA [Geobacter hydrogenophilus]GLI38153.1 magnesium transport protein CorA [Geobacter hydrogenophilus]
MIKAYLRAEDSFRSVSVEPDELVDLDTGSLIWLDLLSPSTDELATVERSLKIELPTRQESEEIEFSSRFWEDESGIDINTYFLVRQDEKFHNETVSFILRGNFVVTIRFSDHRIFTEFSRKLRLSPRSFRDGADILSGILAMRVDMDADTLEALSRGIASLGRRDPHSFENPTEYLSHITDYEDINITIRENLTDKHRVLSSLLKSASISENLKKEFSMMMKDVNSLVISANFNFERLDYIQNLFLNHLSVEQNKVIKIFTVMSVIFLPPTMIASIYGMNYKHMPELEWVFGYPFALTLIILSAVLPLYVFKKKGWL